MAVLTQRARRFNEISIYPKITSMLMNEFGVESEPLLYRKDTTLLDCGIVPGNILALQNALIKKFNLPAKFLIKHSDSWNEIIDRILAQQNTGGDNSLTSKTTTLSKRAMDTFTGRARA
ncbi:MAG: hypothetical protein LBG89_03060 [Rickettsiales bacterium]|jgi:hypothetical protein|nr:hypothetical protein [Rickettsiales bacterium]